MATEVDVNENGTIDIQYGGTNASTAAGARTSLGLGTAAELDAGSAVGEVVVVQTGGKLPTLDGSNLTNVPAAGGSVNSVNGETGEVILDADDISDGVNYAIITKVEQANIASNKLVIGRIEDLEGLVDAAENSAAAALVSKNKAHDWAEEAEDVEVEIGEYSAHHWAIKAQETVEEVPLSAGMLENPGYTDHVNGTITIALEDGHLYSDVNFLGELERYTIPSDTFTLTDGVTNYIVAKYNSGTPIYANLTDVSLINCSTIIPVYTIFRHGNILTIMEWDGLGSGLANRLHFRMVKTERFSHEEGLALSEKNTRELATTSGKVWLGGNSLSLLAADSAVDTFSFFYHSSGSWVRSDSTTQYNNTQYDDGTNLQTLGTAKYGVNWVFRLGSNTGHLCIILGSGNYNLAGALDSELPASIPQLLQTHGILVGRVIVLKGANTATDIQGAFGTTLFGGVAVQLHNDLAGLNDGDYKHLTATELSKLTGIEDSATADQTGAEIKSLYEAEADTNALTDSNLTKLNGIATGAEVNVKSDWTAASGDAEILNKPVEFSFKNNIINGGFDVWQRDTNQTSNGFGSDDRWLNAHTGSTKTHTRQTFTLGQTAVASNPKYFSRTVVGSVAGAGNYVLKLQKIERVAKLAGKTITLSLDAKADASKNITIEFKQEFGTGGTPSTAVAAIGAQKVALTTAWQRFDIEVAIPSISGKTLGTNDNDNLQLCFWFDAGSDFNARTDSLGQQSGTFEIANVQVEEGSIATAFEQRPISIEELLCYRYYCKSAIITVFNSYHASYGKVPRLEFPVPMCAIPTVVQSNQVVTASGTFSSVNSSYVTKESFSTIWDITSGIAGYAGYCSLAWTADAEL